MKVPLIEFVALGLVCALGVHFTLMLAVKRALFDEPNERSSHRVPVPRMGGSAFIPPVLIYLSVAWSAGLMDGRVTLVFITAAGGLYVLGVLDDFLSLRAAPRLLIQFVCVSAVIAMIGATRPWATSTDGTMGIGLVATICVVGILNIYNFMDGIDGIAGVQAVVAGAAWTCIAYSLSLSATAVLGGAVTAGAAGFLLLNWPPARIFMGDAGSTVLGYIIGILPFFAWVEQKDTLSLGTVTFCGALVMWPFLADGASTILRRMRRRENVFTAHRSHLYQRLVIAGRSHQAVTLTYGALAVIGGILAWCVAKQLPFATPAAIATVALLFAALWRFTVACEAQAAALRRQKERETETA